MSRGKKDFPMGMKKTSELEEIIREDLVYAAISIAIWFIVFSFFEQHLIFLILVIEQMGSDFIS